MDRRTFIGTLAGSLLAAPLAVEAQQVQKIPKVGMLAPGTPTAFRPNVEAFRQGLRELGHVEGKTWVLEPRFMPTVDPSAFPSSHGSWWVSRST